MSRKNRRKTNSAIRHPSGHFRISPSPMHLRLRERSVRAVICLGQMLCSKPVVLMCLLACVVLPGCINRDGNGQASSASALDYLLWILCGMLGGMVPVIAYRVMLYVRRRKLSNQSSGDSDTVQSQSGGFETTEGLSSTTQQLKTTEVSLNQCLQDCTRLRNELSRLKQDTEAGLSQLTGRLDRVENGLRGIENEALEHEERLEKLDRDLSSSRAQIAKLESVVMLTGLESIKERLANAWPRLPKELQDIVSGISALCEEVQTRRDRAWFENNLDRIRGFAYGAISPLPVLENRGLASENIEDYYCILRLQYELHKMLALQGLVVISPAKGDPFQRDFHDFSDRDLVWVDDPSQDNKVDAVRRMGFAYTDASGISVLRRAVVRRCVYSSESLARKHVQPDAAAEAGAAKHADAGKNSPSTAGDDTKDRPGDDLSDANKAGGNEANRLSPDRGTPDEDA